MLANSLWVAAGGAIGSVLRFWVGEAFVGLGLVRFPWATLVANVSGSFLIGLVAAWSIEAGRPVVSQELRLFLMVGFCGGYTTFSAFSLQTLNLMEAGDVTRALLNVLVSLAACLLATGLGMALGNRVG